MESRYENLTVEVEGGIATITVNRPKVLNALDDRTFDELDDCVAQIEANLAADRSIRSVIVTGAGEKAFVAGADINELAEQTPLEAQRRSRKGQRIMSRLESLPVPVVAAVNGFALGGGCELALACHLRFAAEGARLGLPEATLGIIPGYGGTQRLTRLVGTGRALQWILSADMIRAEEAERIGLVNGVFPAGELLSETRKYLDTVSQRGPLAIRYAIEAVQRGADLPLAEGLNLESDLFGVISASDDMREGMKAFLEKRKPDFRGQ